MKFWCFIREGTKRKDLILNFLFLYAIENFG